MKRTYLFSSAALSAGLLLSGCSTGTTTTTPTETDAATTTSEAPAMNMGRGLDVANLDTTVNPCQDFYEYANGGWLKNNPVPASESGWGSFNELAEKNNTVLRQLLNEAASNTSAAKGSAAQLVGDFYAVGLDSVAADKAGITPIKPELDRISNIKNTVGSSRVDLQACKLEYSIVSPK